MTTIVSGILLALFAGLCTYEARRGERALLRGVRGWLDRMVTHLFYLISASQIYFGAGAIRMFLHYCIHKVLDASLWTLNTAQSLLRYWQRQNRSVAKTVQKQQERTHLDAIAEHKANITLSEAEKRRLKERSIAG